MDLIKSGRYIDIFFYAKICTTTKLSTLTGYHVVLAMLLFKIAWWPSAGKELSSWLSALAVLFYDV